MEGAGASPLSEQAESNARPIKKSEKKCFIIKQNSTDSQNTLLPVLCLFCDKLVYF